MTDLETKLAEALRELLASISGQPKSCGHQFYCICAGDKALATLAAYERKKAGQAAPSVVLGTYTRYKP